MLKRIVRRRFVFVFSCLLIVAFAFYSQKALVKNAERSASAEPAMLLPAGATKTDALAPGGDVDGDGRVDPGDTIEYTITIPNTTATSGLGVKFTDQLEANLSLVPGSVNSSPIAIDETFTATGNVRIQVPDGANDLLANDIDPDNGSNSGLTTVVETKKSANCTGSCPNNVVINANGSFSIIRPLGLKAWTPSTTRSEMPEPTERPATRTTQPRRLRRPSTFPA